MTGVLLALLVGCASLEAALESPYVLATGLGDARSLALLPGSGLVVASSTGTFRVDGTGAATRIGPASLAVTTLDDRLVWVSDGAVRWGPLPLEGQPIVAAGAVEVAGARDVLGWFDHDALVLTDRMLGRVTFDGAAIERLAEAPAGARALALGGSPRTALLVADDALYAWTDGVLTPVVSRLTRARAAAVGPAGQTLLIHGEPAVLSHVAADGTLTTVARHLDAPADAHCGAGGLLPATHLYLAGASGTVDYLPLPDPR